MDTSTFWKKFPDELPEKEGAYLVMRKGVDLLLPTSELWVKKKVNEKVWDDEKRTLVNKIRVICGCEWSGDKYSEGYTRVEYWAEIPEIKGVTHI